eukprot:g8369.t1
MEKTTRDRTILGGAAAILLLFAGTASTAPAADRAQATKRPATIDFNRDIRPILSDKCFACHGPDKAHRKAELRLDIEADAKKKRDDHYVVVPGKPADSALVKRITSRDENVRMPPPEAKKPLSRRERELLTEWIRQGAVWAKHWAYVPPVKHPVPRVNGRFPPRNWTDAFILSRLEKEGVTPAGEADRVTLIRRLSFDLTGLPPTPEDVDAFVNDRRPAAYERLVDRLLASPAFGERIAAYWLDLVRFADTVGYHGDQDHVISPYRDYVIDALNDNMPFDQFTREQLAGDLLKNPTVEQRIATGYNRLLQTSHEGGVQAKEYLAIYAADRIRNFSQVWMGATMGCCQCHDHKYDPFTARDFYAMQAFFADIDEAQHLRRGSNRLPTIRLPELPVFTRRERHRVDYLQREIKTESAKPKADQQRLRMLKTELAAITKSARKTMITVPIEPRTIRLLPRGNWLDDSGPVMQPAVPTFLGRIAEQSKTRPTRLDLANWLLSDAHGYGPMTARVMVNRLWYLYFGVGISKVLDDFGGQGKPPVHPELLDNLAVEFVNSGWDLKHMIRLIVTSRTYRQSSVPPAGKPIPAQWFAHQQRFRLPAEMIRDNALAVSGLLVRDLGGSSVKPYQPEGYYRHLNFPKRKYAPHTDDRQWRRGVYMHWQRQFLHPMLKAFDAPSREECTAERPRSNTPIAAMTLLNDPTFVEAARVFAARILRNAGPSTDARLDYAFRLAVSRTPDAFERKAQARPRYLKCFVKAFPGLQPSAKKLKCSVCHPGKSKKSRNAYGQRLEKELKKLGPQPTRQNVIEALRKIGPPKIEQTGVFYGDAIRNEPLRALTLPARRGAQGEHETTLVSFVQKDVEDVPSTKRTIADNKRMTYFLIPAAAKQAPKAGYGLLLLLPGGSGDARFHPFVKRIRKHAVPDDLVVAQPVAFKWTEQQRIVWPTEKNKVDKQEFSTEKFLDAIIKDVKGVHRIDPKRVYAMGWSSSGSAIYATALRKQSPLAGSYIMMSVYKPKYLPPVNNGRKQSFYIEHSPDDRICPFWMAEKAQKELKEAGARVKFATYRGGHGFRGNIYGRMRAAFWEWYPQVADRFFATIEEGRSEELVSDVGEFMAETLPEFAWVFGKGEDDGHSFTLSGEGVLPKQLLTQYWLSRGTEIPRWTFHASRQPSPPEQLKTMAIQVGEQEQVDAETLLLRTAVDDENQVVDIVAWHPALDVVPEEHHSQILFLLLDEALGEFGVEASLGRITVEPFESTDDTRPLSELPEFIRQVTEYYKWDKPSPLESYSLYKVPEQSDCRRGDTITGTTCIPYVIFDFLENDGVLPEDPLEGTGAEFAYLAIDGTVFPDGRQTDVRGEIEDAIAEALGAANSGRTLGGAFGTEEGYIDLLLYDGDNSRRIIQETLDSLELSGRSRIESFT